MKQLLFTFLKRQFRSGGFIIGGLLFGGMLAFFPEAFGSAGVQTAGAMIGSGIAFAVVLGWGVTYSSIRNSSLMNGIKVSSVSKTQFMIIAGLAALLMIVVMGAILTSFFIIFVYTGDIVAYTGSYGVPGMPINPGAVALTANEFMESIKWIDYIGGVLMAGVVSASVALVLAEFINTHTTMVTVSWIYSIAVFFFAGASAPITLIRGFGEGTAVDTMAAFKYIAYLLPNSYANFFIADSLSHADADLMSYISNSEYIINTTVPLVESVVLTGASLYKIYMR